MDLPSLRDIFVKYFSDNDLRDVCFDLGIDYENLGGDAKAGKARELVDYCQRHDHLAELENACRRLRPHAFQDSRAASAEPGSTAPKTDGQSAGTVVNQSGGATINAQTVNVYGDVTGRDKTVADGAGASSAPPSLTPTDGGKMSNSSVIVIEKSWKDILDAIVDLNDHLRKCSIRFDYIVSFSGGGLIVADLLHTLHRPKVPVISFVVRRYEAEEPGDDREIKIEYPDTSFFESKDILLLDDVVETGNAIKYAFEFLRRTSGIGKIYTTVLGKAEHTLFKPHYFVFEFSGQCVLPYGKVPRELPMYKKQEA